MITGLNKCTANNSLDNAPKLVLKVKSSAIIYLII